jgi:hypothetical protein
VVRSTSAGLNPKRRYARRVLSYVTLNDFSKGIDARQDKTAIEQGYAQRARNVIWNNSNGFYERRGVGPLTYNRSALEVDAVPGGPPVSYYNYRRGSETMDSFLSQHLMVDEDGKVWVTGDYQGALPLTDDPGPGLRIGEVDGHWDEITGVTRSGVPSYADWDQVLYISMGNHTNVATQPMLRWNGTAMTSLGNAFNDDIANPVGGNMPRGRYVTYLNDRLYVAYIGGAPSHPNRLHFSHPGSAEDWRTEDWIDVGGAGDEISGLIAMRDMLLIFKRDSTWALIGNGPENFRLVVISETIGCTGQFDYAPDGGVVFWDNEQGLVHFDGKTLSPIFAPLRAYVDGGLIRRCKGVVQAGSFTYVATDYLGQSAIPFGEHQNRTWDDLRTGGVTWDALATQRLTWNTFAYETYDVIWVLPPVGGWTQYWLQHPHSPGIGCIGKHRSFVPLTGDTPGTSNVVVGMNGGTPTADRLLYLDRFEDGLDRWGGSLTSVIQAEYLTAWLHGGLPAQIKRWKSPRVIQGAHDDGDVLVDVFHDFDPWTLRRTLTASVAPPDRGAYTYEVEKPGTVGRAKAVSLRLYSHPDVARQWSVHSVVIPLYPKVLR